MSRCEKCKGSGLVHWADETSRSCYIQKCDCREPLRLFEPAGEEEYGRTDALGFQEVASEYGSVRALVASIIWQEACDKLRKRLFISDEEAGALLMTIGAWLEEADGD